MLVDYVFFWFDFSGVSGDEDVTFLIVIVWFVDISASFSLTIVGLEVFIVVCREGLVRRFLCITVSLRFCRVFFVI